MTERTAFLDAQALADGVIRRYSNGETDRVHIVYNRFKSAWSRIRRPSR